MAKSKRVKPEQEQQPEMEQDLPILEEEITYELVEEKPMRKAKVLMIVRGEVHLLMKDGTGERIAYDPILHANLKEGQEYAY